MKHKKKSYYVTTPIYYPSGKPHLGSAYTTIAADILARWHKLIGNDVFFLTGTDEHTKKVVDAAKKEKKSPQEFTDDIIPAFKEAWKKLNIHYDRFIRTSDEDHKKFVEYILDTTYKKGEIYKGTYEGLYCSECEAYYTEREAPQFHCPIHEIALETIKEDSYFFKLSHYQKKLLDYYEKHPKFILPKKRRNEVISRVREGLKDLSISRTNQKWGVQLPFDTTHTAYVWYDALTNYLTGIGILEQPERFKQFWPANVHLVGKDIIWFHAVIWPAMLLSAGIELPRTIFAHGWLTTKEKKIGKSTGNATDLFQLINLTSVDTIRYFLFRATPFGDDGDFSEQALIDRHNNELANKLGNLVSRVSTLAEKYGLEKTNSTLDIEPTHKKVQKHLENYELDKALNEIFAFIDKCNEYIQEKKPWETKDTKVLYELANAIKDFTILLFPFMPATCEKISRIFHFKINKEEIAKPLVVKKVKKAEVLFKKL